VRKRRGLAAVISHPANGGYELRDVDGLHKVLTEASLVASSPILIHAVAPAHRDARHTADRAHKERPLTHDLLAHGRNPLSDLDGFRGIVCGGDAALSISALARNIHVRMKLILNVEGESAGPLG
jgi:hypothetical protein